MSHVKLAIFGIALALMGVTGWAGAAGGDAIVPVERGAGAPGMIRTETCSRPAYPGPEFAQHRGIVTLRLLLGADGRVKRSAIARSSGAPELDEATLAAIAQCSFNPPMAEGKPVDGWIHFQYEWKP
jgi:TonB family protein